MYADPGNVPPGHSSTLQMESSTQDRQPQPPNYERPRLPPRRATQACLVCRQRRVRCDVSFKEGDCTNCMLDELECIVVSSKRRARRTPNEKTLASSSSNQPRTGNESPQGPQQTQYRLQTSRVRRENDLVIRYTERTFLDNSPYIPQQSSQHRSEIRLPGYIKTLDVQKSEDLEFLQRRGVFDLLPLELAQIALSRYEELVYPVLPILDVAELRSAISGESGNEISLLLYHAVMVMALSCTGSETVLQLAHMAKRDLRSASYEKAKALFDMGAEQDRVVLCQACLLLADRDFYTDARDGSYWVGNAILHANYLGLYREVGTAPGSWNTTKILWWCVVMKECDISTYENYPPRVSPFVSPMLALSDFGFEDISMDGGKTASIYIIRAKRCCQLYLVKRQIYDEIQPWDGQKSNSTLRAPRQQLRSQLHSWESDTPSELRSETLQHEFDSRLVGLTCASAMAEIIYWSAYFFIYMPDLRFRVQPSRRIETVVDPEGRPIIRHAASQVATVVERLLALNMGQSLTAPHAWNIAAASFVLLQDTQALDPVIRENALHNLEVCHRAAHTLSEAHPILSQLTLGFQPAEWQPYESQPRTESSSSSNAPTGVDNERGPGWNPQEESTEQTYATNSRLDSRYTKPTGCQVGDVLGWASLG